MQRDKWGELFILGFRGTQLPAWLREFGERFGLGGVILFDYDVKTKTYENNIVSKEQLIRLCEEIHSLPGSPLIVIDQEGGRVRRLKEKLGFTPLPSQATFVHLPTSEKRTLLDDAYREMRAVGIDINLAPVVDLNYNPANPDIGAIERSFGSTVSEIEENVRLIETYARKNGVGLCLKHFPGLGGARVNSHLELTDLTGTFGEEQLELFYRMGHEITGHCILVSHGIVDNWEPGQPISMSRVALKNLRRKLPKATLLSDDLQMQGLQKRLPTGPACVAGIEAGIDLLIVGNNLLDQQAEAAEWATAVGSRAKSDPQFAQTGEAALERVRTLKRLFRV